MKPTHFLLILVLFTGSGALAQIRTLGGLSIPQQGSSTPLNAALYAPDPLLWDAPYPLVSMLPGGGADIISVEWAAQRLAADGYIVIIIKPQFGGSTASYNTAAKSGIDFLLSVANPFLAEANVARIGACGWSLGGRSLTLTQAEDTRLSCIVAWDNLAVSENGDEGSPSGGGTGTPVRTPRVPALGQASEMPGVDAQSKITAWKHWRAHGVPSAQIVFAVGSGLGAHLKWGTSGTTAEHDRFHHYTRAWFDRWLKDDRMGTERLLVDALDGVSAATYLSNAYVGAIFADSYDCEDLRGLVVAGGNPRSLAPSAADPAITSFDAPHFAFRHLAVPPRNRLFLFLPGTGAVPANYLQVLRCSADHGFHALGLAYVNSPSVAELTSGQPPDTAGNVRLEILDGTDRTPLVDVDRINSIENRLITALQYLHSLAPGEGWLQYLDAGPTIRWDRILVAGHSQGGGHAAIISRHHLCSRVISFNAVDWSGSVERPADWMYAPSATPPERVYGVGHLRDPLVPPSLVRQGWSALGIAGLGAEQAPESGSFPFGFTHQFMTDVEPQQAGISTHYHGASVADARTPRDAHALPVLRPFWSHLLLSSGLVPATRLVDGHLTIPTTEDVRYQVETSTDLISWTAVGSPVVGDGNLLVQPVVPAGTATFWRWAVSW
jgi:dienelactone hydrolase